jgi:hypothetical protein
MIHCARSAIAFLAPIRFRTNANNDGPLRARSVVMLIASVRVQSNVGFHGSVCARTNIELHAPLCVQTITGVDNPLRVRPIIALHAPLRVRTKYCISRSAVQSTIQHQSLGKSSRPIDYVDQTTCLLSSLNDVQCLRELPWL